MINATDEFKNLMKYNTNFHAYAEVTLTDGTTFTLSDEDFTVSDNSIIDGSSINSFPLGVAVQKVVRLEILNRHDEYTNHIFTGASIRLYLKYQKSTLVEQIEKGTFTVVIPETYGETIIITAYDDMYKADKSYYSGLVFPQSAGAVLRDICDNCGLELAGSFLNESFVITEKPDGTFREVIGHIAMIACGNARIDSRGYLEIVSYDFNSTPYTLEDFINLKVEANNTVITGVKMIADDDDATEVLEGTDSYVLTVSNPLAKGKEQTLVSYIYERIANIPFMPFNGEYIAHPLIEFMDFVEIHDMGNTYNSFITDVNFVFAGVTSLKNTTPGALRQTSVYNSSSSKAEQLARNLVKKERNAREEAMKKLNEDVQNAGGMHTTSVEQPDGSNIIYMHDKPTLDESKNVMIITSNAVGFSTDGGEAYPFGFKVDGNMIANILTAYGVSADWINTGALVVKDADGEIIFSADISTSKVIVSGDSVRIGDKTATQAIQDASNQAALARNMVVQLSNEYQAIPVDSNGNYSSFPDCSTVVNVMYGSADVSNQSTYSIAKSSSVTGSWNSANRTYTVTALTADTGWVDITATYAGTLKITKRFTVAKLYAGANGQDGKDGKDGENGKDGADGAPGAPGTPGTPGENGKDGLTTYFHVKYSSVANPTTATQMTETPSKYIGTYVDYTESDSTDPSKYTWSQFMGNDGVDGKDGEDGIPGTNGINGETYYLHIKYSDDGGKSFTSNNGETSGTYIGVYTDTTKADSTEVSKYTWSLIKGADGANGKDGQDGVNGKDGKDGVDGADGADARSYILELSTNVVKRSKDNTISPNFIEFSAYYRDGQSTNRTSYSGIFVIEETVDGNTWNKVYESSSAESSIRHELYAILTNSAGEVITNVSGQAIGVPRDVTNIRCTLYDSTKSNVLDVQSAVVVTDVDALSFEEIFNILTKNGAIKGIYQEGDQLYISFTYARGGELALGGENNGNGVLKVMDATGATVGMVSNLGAIFNKGKIANWNISTEYGLVDDSGQITISPKKLNSHSQFAEGYTKIYGDLIQTDYMSIMKSFTCYGTKNRAIPTNEYNTVLQYCYEMPSPMFGDIGCGTVEDNGLCYVEIDPIFAETANSQIEYYVFLQKEGEGDAYVLEKTASYFVVKGTPGLKFAWELKAKQIGYELMRLETM